MDLQNNNNENTFICLFSSFFSFSNSRSSSATVSSHFFTFTVAYIQCQAITIWYQLHWLTDQQWITQYTQAGVLTHKVCSSSNLNQLHHGITECASSSWLKALAANWVSHPANLYASLIGFHPSPALRSTLQGISSLAMDLGLCGIFYFRSQSLYSSTIPQLAELITEANSYRHAGQLSSTSVQDSLLQSLLMNSQLC